MYEIYPLGIRHHGPGSARRVLHALKKIQADCICIELPFESEVFFQAIHSKKVETPFAILFCNKDKVDQSFYLPMAEFSPEYQAILYGIENNIPVYAIDLPAKYALVYSNFRKDNMPNLDRNQSEMIRDPIGYLAKVDGYKDSERWWDIMIEMWGTEVEIFNHVYDLMKELRIKSKGWDDKETLLREIYMRQRIQSCIDQGATKIAVVCGAWHAPVLDKEHLSKAKKIIPTLKAVDTLNTLIPWSFQRLAQDSNYSAGVVSPVWNEYLFASHNEAASMWLTHVAQTLRQKNYVVSTAEIIEASKMSEALAYIRNLKLPGLEELIESAVIVFGQGQKERIDYIKSEIIYGNKTGKIDIHALSFPIQIEFKNKLKQTKLVEYWESAKKEVLKMDLRKSLHLERSKFLHSICLLGLGWVKPDYTEYTSHSNFHENWSMHWSPELEIELVKIGFYGNTLEEAVQYKLNEVLSHQKEIFQIIDKIEHIFKCGYSSVADQLLLLTKEAIIENTDVIRLSSLLRPLYAVMEFGGFHQIANEHIQELIDILLPKIIIYFPEAIEKITDDEVTTYLQLITQIEFYLEKSKDQIFISIWDYSLFKLLNHTNIQDSILGKVTAILLEKNKLNMEDILPEIRFRFEAGIHVEKALNWLKGYLFQATQFSSLHPKLIESLYVWVQNIEQDNFKQNLPLLRKIFSELPESERIRIRRYEQKGQNREEINARLKVLNQRRKDKIDLFLQKKLSI